MSFSVRNLFRFSSKKIVKSLPLIFALCICQNYEKRLSKVSLLLEPVMEMDDSLFDLNIVCVDETGTWTIVPRRRSWTLILRNFG